jgi:hypothetical protein
VQIIVANNGQGFFFHSHNHLAIRNHPATGAHDAHGVDCVLGGYLPINFNEAGASLLINLLLAGTGIHEADVVGVR